MPINNIPPESDVVNLLNEILRRIENIERRLDLIETPTSHPDRLISSTLTSRFPSMYRPRRTRPAGWSISPDPSTIPRPPREWFTRRTEIENRIPDTAPEPVEVPIEENLNGLDLNNNIQNALFRISEGQID